MNAFPNDKITVAINALTDLAPLYGSRVYLFGLARGLLQLPQVDLILLVGRGQKLNLPRDLQDFGVEVSVPISRSYWQFLFAHRIHRALTLAGASVWHLPNSLPIVSKPLPTLITIHDLADLRVRKYGRLRTLYRRLTNYLAAHRADHVLTVSQNSKCDLLELFNIPENKVTVIYPGVDETFRPLEPVASRAYLSAKYRIPNEFILAPGGLAPNKNVHGLLHAVAKLRQKGIDHSLVCTGHAHPRELNEIKKTIEKLNLTREVILTGHVPVADLPKFYNASAAMAYVSTYEGFGLPILEAMSCGVPVVASERASIPEVAGESTLLVNPEDSAAIADALYRALTDLELRSSLIASGLDRARRFTWRRTAAQTLAAYQHVLDRTQGAPQNKRYLTVAE